MTLGCLLIIVRLDTGTGFPLLTMSQERGSQLEAGLSPRTFVMSNSEFVSAIYVDETLFRTSPSPRTHRRCLEKTLIFLFARVMEVRTPSLLTLLAITWLDAR